MTFKPRNAYYLRLSANLVLPLFLYLDEQHVDWMSDTVLQHVLADLRPLVIPKLEAEKDVHFGLGAVPGTKRGSVEVHRGETYQFAYFFRKTEPHTVLFKSRHFVTAPLRPKMASGPITPLDQMETQVSVRQSKRKRARNKGKGKGSQRNPDEDEWSAEEGERSEMDAVDPISRRPRRIRKQCHVAADGQDDDGVKDAHENVAMESLPPVGKSTVSAVALGDTVFRDTSNEPNLSPDMVDVPLVVEEEEVKPKPLLKLKYQSFSISGHCLCVVIEPWPSQRVESRSRSVDVATSLRRGNMDLSSSNEYIAAGQRAETPLFLPENDRQPSEAPFARHAPPVPLFHDNDDSGDDLMSFSQTLNAGGHMHAFVADDDDDMDGAVLFADADEVKELT